MSHELSVHYGTTNRGRVWGHLTPLLFLVCLIVSGCLFCGAALASGSIYTDTADITGTANEYSKVPVYIDGNDICAFQFVVGLQDDSNAKIEIDTSSRFSDQVVINGKTGVVYWYAPESEPEKNLNGKTKIFDIVVTPNTESDVVLSLDNAAVYEHSSSNLASYSIAGSTLSVTSTSTNPNPEEFVDENGGSTDQSGVVDSDGSYEVTSSSGVSKVSTDSKYSGDTIYVAKGTTGNANLPSTVKYYSADVVSPPTETGDEYRITLKVPASKLAETGKSAEDIVVLHSVSGNQWYTIPVVKVETLANGDAEITVDAWAAGTYVLAYDLGGNSYPSEGTSTISELESTVYPDVVIPEEEILPSTPKPTQTAKPTSTQSSPFPVIGLIFGSMTVLGLVLRNKRE